MSFQAWTSQDDGCIDPRLLSNSNNPVLYSKDIIDLEGPAAAAEQWPTQLAEADIMVDSQFVHHHEGDGSEKPTSTSPFTLSPQAATFVPARRPNLALDTRFATHQETRPTPTSQINPPMHQEVPPQTPPQQPSGLQLFTPPPPQIIVSPAEDVGSGAGIAKPPRGRGRRRSSSHSSARQGSLSGARHHSQHRPLAPKDSFFAYIDPDISAAPRAHRGTSSVSHVGDNGSFRQYSQPPLPPSNTPVPGYSHSVPTMPTTPSQTSAGYSCTYPDCNSVRVFNTRAELNKHWRKHVPKAQRPHGCPVCEWRFQDPRELERHIKAKHEHVKIRCPRCTKEITRKDGLKRHMLVVHGEVMPAAISLASFITSPSPSPLPFPASPLPLASSPAASITSDVRHLGIDSMPSTPVPHNVWDQSPFSPGSFPPLPPPRREHPQNDFAQNTGPPLMIPPANQDVQRNVFPNNPWAVPIHRPRGSVFGQPEHGSSEPSNKGGVPR